jgi:hypothetical protein
LHTFGLAATVDLGSGGVNLKAWSGASTYVKAHWHFGTNQANHWICGNDAGPASSSRVFLGG